MSVTGKIRNIRAARGISQEQLAERINVSRQTISKWENGLVSPSSDNLLQLSQALDVPVDALLNEGWTPPEPQVVEVQVPRPGNRRVWALLAALVLAAGIVIGALLVYGIHENSVPISSIDGELVNQDTIIKTPLLPLE